MMYGTAWHRRNVLLCIFGRLQPQPLDRHSHSANDIRRLFSFTPLHCHTHTHICRKCDAVWRIFALTHTNSVLMSANQTCSIMSPRAQHSGKRCKCACRRYHFFSLFAGKNCWTLKTVNVFTEIHSRWIAENTKIYMHVVGCTWLAYYDVSNKKLLYCYFYLFIRIN